MKIGVKISIGFIIVNLLLAVIVLLGLYSLNNMSSEINRIAYKEFPKTVWANNVIDAINEGARALRNLILTNDADETKNNFDRIDNVNAAVVAAMDSLNANIFSERGKELMADLQSKREIYVRERDNVFTLILSGDMDGATNYLLNDLRQPQRDYINAVNEVIAYQTSLVTSAAEEANETYSQMFMILLIVAIISIVFAILITVFLVRSITKPLNQAVEAAENISKGNMNVNLETTNKDETAVLLGAMKTMSINIKKLVEELNATSEAAVAGKLDKRADESAFQGEYKNIMKGVNGTLDAVIGPLNVTAEYVDRISKGDIPPRITDEYKGDFNEIKNNLNQCIDSVNLLVTDAKMLSRAAIEGKLDTRANASKHNGEFRAIVQGVNDTLDNVIGPLNVAAEYVDRISKGDIPPRITDEYKGDFNEIKNNLNGCIDSVNALVADAKMLAKAAVEGKLDTRANASKHNGEFRAIVQGVNDTLDNVIGPLNVAAEYVDRISKGDIPPRITDEYKGDFNEIKNNVNVLIEATNNITEVAKKLSVGNTKVALTKRSAQDEMIAGLINVINNIQHDAENIQKLSKGDLNFKVDIMSDDDEMAKSIKILQSTLGDLIGDMNEMSKQHDLGDIDIIIPAKKYEGSFQVMAQGVNDMVNGHISVKKKAMGCFMEFGNGNLDAKIEQFPGKKAFINETIEKVRNNIKALVTDAKMLAQAAVDGKLSTRADASKHQGEFRAIVDGVNQTLDSVIEPINEAGEVLSIMAGGDLTVRVVGNYKGELSKLKNDINSLAEALSYLLTQVNEVVHSAASSALEISSTAESLAASTQEQSAQSDEVASAVEEMSRTVTENAMSASKTAEVAQNNGYIATEGGKVVQQTVVKMREIAGVVKNSAGNIEKLGESSKQIGEIISVIDDIADQTNLLALNAAIEAARAGEQGRGFAVVADEVRKLAERTTEATKQIANMIKGIQKETEHAVIAMNQGTTEVQSGISLADNAGESLKQILSSTQEVMDMISQIASASEEQSATSEQISKNVLSISKVSAESAHRVEDVAHTADELAKLTEHLSELMTQFKVDGSSKQAGSGKSIDSGKKGKHLAANN